MRLETLTDIDDKTFLVFCLILTQAALRIFALRLFCQSLPQQIRGRDNMPWPMRSVAKVITPWRRPSKSNVKLEAQKLVCFLETSIQFSTHFLYSGFILLYFNILSSAQRTNDRLDYEYLWFIFPSSQLCGWKMLSMIIAKAIFINNRLDPSILRYIW